ncbi:MAG: tRNA pseudouridine(38-40) synthase TruA [Sedimentisphaerales bacterium]|jgi:tRNA pseudouridine38-40 synthase|nr:tRNA pseudouridine(38-40) synthase TruA [Sedimentisphaerales bacterium]
MAQRKILLTIAYDGTDYFGWQKQPGLKTIQQTINQAASDLVGHKVHVHGASRTDAGVHALGQVGLMETETPIPTENFVRALNDRLPPDIAILAASEPPWNFDLIGAVKRKLYRYCIHTGPIRPVLDIRYCWHLPSLLDVEAMNEAARALVGRHDFKSFASAKDKRKDTVRTIFRCEVYRGVGPRQDYVYVEVEGKSFLHNMVRNIVGTLVEVGQGKRGPDQMASILQARDRTAAGQIAPPSGLCLMWIKYD